MSVIPQLLSCRHKVVCGSEIHAGTTISPVSKVILMQIGVIGPGDCTPEEYAAAMMAGELIAEQKCVLLCGGLSGVMEAACRGAKVRSGRTVGIIPHTGEGNPYIDLVIRTGIGYARNAVLVQSSDAIVAIGGSYGTLSEIAIALKIGRTVCGYQSWDIPGVSISRTPEEAVSMAISAARRFLSDRTRRAGRGQN
jgi:uncharacterized protein (TIGR00725 family)